jgi:hypothetical protein
MRQKSVRALGLFGAFVLSVFPVPAMALDWSTNAHVDVIEGSYLPTQLNFQIDVAAGSCAAHSWLFWNSHGSNDTEKHINIQGVYSLLLTAHASGKQIWLAGNNTGCSVEYIWII